MKEPRHTLTIYLVGMTIVAITYFFAFHSERDENVRLKKELKEIKNETNKCRE